MVMEKQGEVAILQTQGLTPRQIMAVFMVQGASAGIIGALLGAALGALLASQLNNLMPIIGALLDGAALPVAIEPLGGRYCAEARWLLRCSLRFILLAGCRHSAR